MPDDDKYAILVNANGYLSPLFISSLCRLNPLLPQKLRFQVRCIHPMLPHVHLIKKNVKSILTDKHYLLI